MGQRPIFSEPSVIQAKLNRRLGPEYVSQRPSPGGGPKLTYVEGWKIIGLANEVFGYDGWSSTVTRIETDFLDMDPESRRYWYGSGENLKSKGAALDKAKKEAVTDGVKRALRNFGNLLGLCLYEKSFAQEVIKIKPQLVSTPNSEA
ncbi:Rad52/22 double-strand break repair protein [Lactarius quietus]|nr:Rad52/22 double-strand break repair protein [Lactarius quietus]